MKARIFGCRGSLATPGPDTVRYGGNTSCVSVAGDDGTMIVLDAGTGIRALGLELTPDHAREVHVLLSHLHMDHIQGLGFFRPLFDPDVTVHVWGPSSPVQPLTRRIASYLSPPLFPVSISELPCRLELHDAGDDEWSIGGFQVRCAKVAHQGPTVGYRLTEGERSLTYLPDHEPALGVDLGGLDPSWISGHELAHRTDVLIHDAQYGDADYLAHVGWGHSSRRDALTFASKAEVGSLVLFHHDPLSTDAVLDARHAEALEIWDGPAEGLRTAFEGMEIALEAAAVRTTAQVPVVIL